MTKKLTDVEVNEVSIVGKGAVDANYVIYKSMDGGTMENIVDIEKGAGIVPDKKKLDEEQLLADEMGEPDAPGVIPKKIKKEDTEVIATPVVSEVVLGKETEDLKKEMADLKKMVEERDVKLAKMEDERLTKEFVEKAQAYPYAGKAEEFGPILKEISAKAPEAFTGLEKALVGMTAQIKEGMLFKELGKSTGPAATTIVGKVTELAKAKVGTGVTLEKAINQVLAENPALYDEYRREKQ